VDGSTIYCTHKPCISCVKDLINAGIRRIIYLEGYPTPSFYDTIVKTTGVELVASTIGE